jgi:hypothetical protein
MTGVFEIFFNLTNGAGFREDDRVLLIFERPLRVRNP